MKGKVSQIFNNIIKMLCTKVQIHRENLKDQTAV
jgi:hypothetical protein